ncbi:Proteasome assembly chaperone 2 [Coemansia sp. RSA 2599]|nr:Proteasome assembly chaperone 2 [Coemansia sp. RSA 2598]KAJ1828675.1 Proteasome assembly chaperone 2 [Coemansia sp. RSA 2599]
MFVQNPETPNIGTSTQGSTLLVPAVSIGNVPQLAVDLLINTLQTSRIGILDSPSLTPISGTAGYDHLGSETRSLPLEVYQTKDAKWTILQQRSPPLPKHHRKFASELLEYIKSGGFSRVVVLASSDAALRTDALIDGSQIRTLSVDCLDEELAARLKELSLGELSSEASGYSTGGGADGLKPTLRRLHAAGVTRPLVELCKQAGVPIFAMVSFVNEGDNIPDAIALANAANTVLGVADTGRSEVPQWRPPQSWQWLMPSAVPDELF